MIGPLVFGAVALALVILTTILTRWMESAEQPGLPVEEPEYTGPVTMDEAQELRDFIEKQDRA